MTVYLVDLSNHDWGRRTVNLAEMRKAGISGATHKATEGNWFRDPYLPQFTAQLGSAKFAAAGTYGVINHGIDPVAQAEYWFDYVNLVYPAWRTHPCWIWQIDAEPLDGYAAPSRIEIIAAGRRIEKLAGVGDASILCYGPQWVYGGALAGIPYRLWASAYGANMVNPFRSNAPADDDDRWAAYSGQTPFALQFGSRNVVGGQNTVDVSAVRVADESALVAALGGKQSEEFRMDTEAKDRFDRIEEDIAGLRKRLDGLFSDKSDDPDRLDNILDRKFKEYGFKKGGK